MLKEIYATLPAFFNATSIPNTTNKSESWSTEANHTFRLQMKDCKLYRLRAKPTIDKKIQSKNIKLL